MLEHKGIPTYVKVSLALCQEASWDVVVILRLGEHTQRWLCEVLSQLNHASLEKAFNEEFDVCPTSLR